MMMMIMMVGEKVEDAAADKDADHDSYITKCSHVLSGATTTTI